MSNYQTVCLVETILTRGKQHLSLNIFGELAKKRIFDDAVQVSGVIGGQKLKKFGSDFLDQKSEQRKIPSFPLAFDGECKDDFCQLLAGHSSIFLVPKLMNCNAENG